MIDSEFSQDGANIQAMWQERPSARIIYDSDITNYGPQVVESIGHALAERDRLTKEGAPFEAYRFPIPGTNGTEFYALIVAPTQSDRWIFLSNIHRLIADVLYDPRMERRRKLPFYLDLWSNQVIKIDGANE